MKAANQLAHFKAQNSYQAELADLQAELTKAHVELRKVKAEVVASPKSRAASPKERRDPRSLARPPSDYEFSINTFEILRVAYQFIHV